MFPSSLKAEHFHRYPPKARRLAADHLAALQRLPLSLLPSLLREIIEYDFKFPAERRGLESELANLDALSDEQTKEWFQEFSRIRLSPALEHFDWVNAPAQFLEKLSAHLWATRQMDLFRKAAVDYMDRLRKAIPPELPATPRLGIAVIGQGVTTPTGPLFRRLRDHGTFFSRIKHENGLKLLLDVAAARARAHPITYGHWYIDGGQEADHQSAITCVSYRALQPAREALLQRMRAEIERPGMGPETLRTLLSQMDPADIGLGDAEDPVLHRFQAKLLTEGSGTQIFSTIFAQWASREAWRRAQPLTLLVRFAPRQRQRSMNELLSESKKNDAELDPAGSLIDADMGAYYSWLSQQRLPGAEQASFLVWFENHAEALAIGPSMPRGTESATPVDLQTLLSWMT